MLSFNLLKERFSIISIQRKLSVLDFFIHLTSVKIDLDWDEEQKRNILQQFRGWYFEVDTVDQQQFYIQLIESMLHHVDKDAFIQGIDHQQAWYEQWMSFYLAVQLLNHNNLVGIAKKIFSRSYHPLHEDLLLAILKQAPSFETKFIIANFYLKYQKYDQALLYYQQLIKQYSQQVNYYEQALTGLLTTLLRRNSQYSAELRDAEFALNILLALIEKDFWSQKFEQFLMQAREQALFDPIKQGRGRATSNINSIGRGLSLFGKKIGKVLGGRESSLPYSQDVISSAPIIITGLEIEKSLKSSVRLNYALEKLLKQKMPDHEAMLSALGLTIGMLWTYSLINIEVLDAISFASADSPNSFTDLQDIAEQTLRSTGAITRLSGYVAEQQVALDLVRNGHVVEVPDTANQAGWDLLVDGIPVQVKCSMDANYVLSHFEKYPDIPIITNRELADQVDNHPMITVDPNLSYVDIQAITNNSLQHLDEFDSINDLVPIPLFSLFLAVQRNYRQVIAGQVNLTQYTKYVGTDVAVRTVGAVSGKTIGGFIGGIGGPVGIIVGSGVGAYLGGLAGGTGVDKLIREDLCNQRDVVVKELIIFTRWFNTNVVKSRVRKLQEKEQLYLLKIAKPLQQQIGFSEQPIYAQFIALQNENLKRVQALHVWLNEQINNNEFYQVQAGWVALRESSKFFHPEMKSRIEKINTVLELYQQLCNPQASESKQTYLINLQ
ncbi:hypothetical protein [Acinetobacter sp. Leaf130]|uniref:hypothetical protein n=1 Tax=Acinetobacter sp. Leaf130 TaxID=1736269 RepID=UPI0006F67168|nr:hypothetical protein [Acinetobacter sp. Leaf130]KQQ76117.1 hypothetical protein ASF86_01040 [Acinetobacter sp. Leaf130]